MCIYIYKCKYIIQKRKQKTNSLSICVFKLDSGLWYQHKQWQPNIVNKKTEAWGKAGTEMATTCISRKEGPGLQSKDQPLQNALRFVMMPLRIVDLIQRTYFKKLMHFVGTYFWIVGANCRKQTWVLLNMPIYRKNRSVCRLVGETCERNRPALDEQTGTLWDTCIP